MTPHFYLTSGFYSLPAQTLLISASGANNDICRTFEAGKANLQEMNKKVSMGALYGQRSQPQLAILWNR